MDQSLKARLSELEAAKLPTNLTRYIYLTGRQRSDFTDFREWNQHAVMYKTMKLLQGQKDFMILATRLLDYLDRHPPSILANSKSPERHLTRKKKNSQRAQKSNNMPNHKLAAKLRNAKPSAASMIETWRTSPVIGLGLESTLRPAPRTRREDVKLDEHTQPLANQERSHILYAAGWSLNPDEL